MQKKHVSEHQQVCNIMSHWLYPTYHSSVQWMSSGDKR